MEFELVDLFSAEDQFPQLKSSLRLIEASAQEVCQQLGCGHSEAVYQKAMEWELRLRGCTGLAGQSVLPVEYKGCNVGFMQPDILLLEQQLVVELKTVVKDQFSPESPEVAQLAAYVRLLKAEIGLLINFPKTLAGSQCVIVALCVSQNQKDSPSKRRKLNHIEEENIQ